jgi:kynurenine formamidase
VNDTATHPAPTGHPDAPAGESAAPGFRAVGEKYSNWGRWGADDELGTLNHLTPERRAAAARLVQTGVTIPLGLPFDAEGPQPPGGPRQNPVHMMTRLGDAPPAPGGFQYLDDAIFLHSQCATQIDGLAHVAYDGLLYNGHPVDVVGRAGASRLGVEGFRNGVIGRGVLLDVARHLGFERLPGGEHIDRALLEATAAGQGVAVRPGDVVLIRTGWMTVFTEDGDRERFMATEPGLVLDAVGWLHDHDVAFAASDTWGVEVSPGERADEEMAVHCVLVRDLGMPLGEMLDLETVAEHAARTGRWEFLFACQPLPITGGVGSPIAPTATF